MLSPGRFDRLLSSRDGMGQQLSWARATQCPCRNPITGAARIGCLQCAGKGVFWAASVPAWAGMASMKVARDWAAFGQFETGDVVLTVPNTSPFWAAGEWDRAIMINSSEPFDALLTYTGAEKANFPVVSFDQVVWLNTSQAVVMGGLPVQNPDRTLSWPAGSPPSNTQYSLRGRKRPEYFVFKDFPQDRAHFGGLPLPRRVIMRKFDLFGK